jgi:hypothetical protein
MRHENRGTLLNALSPFRLELVVMGDEPRAHHYVPQCWLAGFTEDGEKTGLLWVTDLERKKQWQTTPANAGHQRDFYRLDEPAVDPVIFEKHFSTLEGEVAPLLKYLYLNPRWPTPEELAILEVFIAFQYIRVPAFRPTILDMSKRIHRTWIDKVLKSPQTWEKALRGADIPPESKGSSYEGMREFIRSGDYSMTANTDWFLMRGIRAAIDAILPALRQRYWRAMISRRGSFVGSDNPVAFDGQKGQMTGFMNADVVLCPLNKYILLYSMRLPEQMLPSLSYKTIAHQNTFSMLKSQYIYSPMSEFCWENEIGKTQIDWGLFNRDNFSLEENVLKDK